MAMTSREREVEQVFFLSLTRSTFVFFLFSLLISGALTRPVVSLFISPMSLGPEFSPLVWLFLCRANDPFICIPKRLL